MLVDPPASDVRPSQVEWAQRSWFEAQAQADSSEEASGYFSHAVSGYQRFRHGQIMAALRRVRPTLQLDSMLDIGCATGVLTSKVAQEFGFRTAVGADFVPEVLAEGRRLYPAVDFREVALPDLPFPDGSFNLVIASEVLYYLTPEAQRCAIDEIRRVLKPSGHFLFTSVLGDPYFSIDGARRLLSGGFHINVERTLRMAGYHALTNPFYLAARLRTMLATGTEPASAEMRARLDRLRPILSTRIARTAVRVMARIGQPLLASVLLPTWFNGLKLGRRTNVIVVAQRV